MSPLFSSVDLLLPPGSPDEELSHLVTHSETTKADSPRKRSQKRHKSSKALPESGPNSGPTTVTLEEKESKDEASTFFSEEQASLHAESQARYFSESNVVCSNCGLAGHFSVFCPEEVVGRRCFLCGGEGHLARNCSEELCHNCLRPGHKRKNCTLPRRDWRREEKHAYPKYEDLKNVKKLKCYICGKTGHLDCSFEKMKFCKSISCYNCGQSGHSGGSCRRPRADEYLSISNRLVRTYSRPNRKKRPYDMKEDAIVFTEQVERALKERHFIRRMSTPSSFESIHRESNKLAKQRRLSNIHS
ncbi:hypothetical protein Gasu2_66740 [Galdieria sulphuraria]|uniref:Cellular nucleic acid-binding protein n=1 Tax=Galdieria sulphuraria TaxID=130081 RepID=M2XT80_GALSU|nr:cellular nucleic acid-binding protein [Galdieria sulphuraria]EME26843.1 cellular nucleic acid-binding protein [Galdieria sulphuraria]GJD12599.1 hypothetical protein Gasu2_66740 [Galdieria sulphuraria]|eukprot:XP_005703363.1 cellular nucleic acid-binding protein [Galdieria sulphuraria]